MPSLTELKRQRTRASDAMLLILASRTLSTPVSLLGIALVGTGLATVALGLLAYQLVRMGTVLGTADQDGGPRGCKQRPMLVLDGTSAAFRGVAVCV